jgi:RND family efflux transporter MFP subunit
MSRTAKIVLPIAVVLVGVAAAAIMIKTANKTERGVPPQLAPVVDLVDAEPQDLPARVNATGTVVPAREVTISPEVSGRVVYVSDKLRRGERLRKGDVMVRLDARDYELGVRMEASRVQQAELELSLEQERGAIARREWEMLASDSAGSGELARREPHLQTAEQGLESARSGLERAKLALERTTIRAPFASLVREEAVEIGQVVAPGSRIATLLGSETFWVDVSVPVDHLAVLDVPGFGSEIGSEALVTHDLGAGSDVVRQGHVIGLAAELDPQTRTARVLVAIDDPLGSPEGGLPLMPGAFVDVTFQGRTLEGAFAVPRTALVDGSAVWLANAEDSLVRRTVEVAWTEADIAIVTSGLEPGDRVITTRMSLPISGMKVRPPGSESPEVDGAPPGVAGKGKGTKGKGKPDTGAKR